MTISPPPSVNLSLRSLSAIRGMLWRHATRECVKMSWVTLKATRILGLPWAAGGRIVSTEDFVLRPEWRWEQGKECMLCMSERSLLAKRSSLGFPWVTTDWQLSHPWEERPHFNFYLYLYLYLVSPHTVQELPTPAVLKAAIINVLY